MATQELGEYIKIQNITLDYKNPRHEPFERLEEVIENLCKNEDILALARDIIEHGLNRTELLAVLKGNTEGTYICKEGNRRLCAVKLLLDPDLAPSDLRKSFENLSDGDWIPITELPVAVYETQEEINILLERIHNGANKGIGRKQWNADQKARHNGESKNKLALNILDYAEKEGMITAEGRKNRITTVQRFFSNAIMKDTLGIVQNDLGDTSRNRQEDDFKKMAKQFIEDLLEGKVSSRDNKNEIVKYAHKLGQMEGLSTERVKPISIVATTKSAANKIKEPKPKKPATPKTLTHNVTVQDALDKLGNFKLQKLYFSLCKVSLIEHTQLICIGYWSFVECLTAVLGAGSNTSMIAFFSKSKLDSLGLGKELNRSGIMEAIKRTSQHGNTTKHDAAAANFHPEQLANDYVTMQPLILKCIEKAVEKKT